MKKILSMLLVAAMTISMVTVVSFAEEETVAKIGDTGYATLAAAVEAVVDATETTIILTKDTKGSGVVIPSGRNITIDLNEFTYDVGNPTVGSVGTETNGFQLLKNSNITIKNGKITSQEAKFLIQNYANLTLDKVILDGSELKEAAANYTLSNNCGDITINNSTIIADTDAVDFAFDVCDYSVYTGVTVTVTGDSKIDGNIEITNPNGGENNAKLVVEGGSFTDIATAVENAENGATVKLLKDTKGPGVVIPSGREITVDLNTFTYDVGNPTVGSVGTETNGFQLLKNSTITITNGTIKSEEAKFLIQNYANLTLDKVILDGSELKEAAVNYTLSNNCGDITINDSTIIADTDAADFAFDVCDYSVYTGVTVTVTGDSRINGAFEVTNPNGGDNNAKLIINGGKFTKDPSAYLGKGKISKNIADSEPYLYQVTALGNENVTIVPPSSTVVAPDESDTEAVKDVASAVTAPSVAGDGAFDAAIEDAAKDVEIEEEDAKSALEDAIGAIGEETPVHLYVQPSVEIKVAEAELEDDKYTSITFDIEIYTQVVASTADNHDEIVLDGGEQNAVVIPDSKTPMVIDEPVVVTIPVSEELKAKLPEKIRIKHIKDSGEVYYYEATFDGNNIVFENPNGFSEFVVEEDDERSIAISFRYDGDEVYDIDEHIIEDMTVSIFDVGTTLSLVDAYKSGYRFDGWSFGDDDEEYDGDIELKEELWNMLCTEAGEGNTVIANANLILEKTTDRKGAAAGGIYVNYTVQFNTTGGSDIKAATVSKGGKVTEPAAPTKGDLVFDGWYTDKSFNTKYNFDSPVYSSFTLYAKWTSESATVFTDVKEGDWFFDVVNEAYTKGLMKGMGDGSFSPETDVTRGMFATVLYRIAGEPAITAPSGFADVDSGAYYANAIAWASESGIANGMTETEFMPERSITREQIATLLYRYAQMIGEDVSVGEDTNILSYGDFASISEYAIPAIQWACGSGMMQGYPEGVFMPQNSATRAETAAVFVRMLNTK